MCQIPAWVVILEFPYVTDPPDMVANPAGFFVSTMELLFSDLLTDRDCFKHRATTEATATNIVDFGDSRSRIEMVKGIHQIVTVNVVAHLLALVTKDTVGIPGYRTLHKVRKEAV